MAVGVTGARALASAVVLVTLLPGPMPHAENAETGIQTAIDPAVLDEGAHRAHVLDTPKHVAYACQRCHARGGPAVTLDGWDPATSSCAASYCHGGAPGGVGQSPRWQLSSAGGLACNACHGYPPISGAHRTHTAADRYKIGCFVCHGGTDWLTHHTAGSPYVVLDSRAGASEHYAALTCSGVVCHSNGRGIMRTVRWTDASLSCGSCHDDETSTAPHMSGQHIRHVRLGVACADCHGDVVDRDKRIINYALHANGSVDVKMVAGRYSAGSCQPACHEPRTW